MPILDKNLDEWYRTARFAFYLRTSSERQEKEGTAETQLDDIWRKVHQLFPWVKEEDVIIYRDEGWSGTSLERPEMDQLRIDLRDNKWDVLICYDQDRIARDPYLQLTILEEIEKRNKKLMFCTTDAPTGSSDSMMMFEFRGLMTKYERVRSLDRFRIGKLRKVRSKKILLSVPPYGYNLIKKHTDAKTGVIIDSHIVINEEEAKVVKLIFTWLADEGMTLRKIARRLFELKVKPRKNKEGKWNTSTLGSLVRNETYIGLARYQTTQAIEPKKRTKAVTGPIKNRKTSRTMRPKEEWFEIPVPAILDTEAERELFVRAQAQLLKNAAISPRVRKNDYLVGGVIRCSCGSARTGEGPQGGRYLYYRCGSRNRGYVGVPKCNIDSVNARIVDEAVWMKLSEIITDPTALRAAFKKHQGSKGSVEQGRVAAIKVELAKCERQYADLKQSFLDGDINVREYTSLKSDVENKEVSLRDRLSSLETRLPTMQSTIPEEHLEALLGLAPEYIEGLSFDQKRGIVVRLVDNIVAVPGSLEITGHVGVGSSSPETYNISQVNYSSNSLQNHVEHKTIGRNCRSAKRGKIHVVYRPHKE